MKNKYIVVGFCDSSSCSPKAGKYTLKTRLGGTTCPTCKGALYMQRQERTTDNHYEVQFEKRSTKANN